MALLARAFDAWRPTAYNHDMNMIAASPFSRLANLPSSVPTDSLVSIELQDGVPVFRASSYVQKRIDVLLWKQRDSKLTRDETDEIVRNQLYQQDPRES